MKFEPSTDLDVPRMLELSVTLQALFSMIILLNLTEIHGNLGDESVCNGQKCPNAVCKGSETIFYNASSDGCCSKCCLVKGLIY